jgi:hypothetical protein
MCANAAKKTTTKHKTKQKVGGQMLLRPNGDDES